MKKSYLVLSLSILSAGTAMAQGAVDAYRISQPDLKGTARFMSMGGAFGALGGDLSSISYNPGGIGIYRSNEIGFTIDLDAQSATSTAQGNSYTDNRTKLLLNNVGAVFTLKLPSYTFPNLNIGFTYNKGASFNRQYGGYIPKLNTSLSNYIAGVSNSEGVTLGDVSTVYKENSNTILFDPYNPNDDGYAAPWISILGYDSYLVAPVQYEQNGNTLTDWYGQWGAGTSGNGQFLVTEKGSRDDYNIVIGGNIANVVYWGMNFDIANINYTMNAMWGESLTDAYVPDDDNVVSKINANWDLNNYYNVNGSGFKYQIGFIIKPIQELRLGLSVSTPTWYNLTQTFGAEVDYQYADEKPGYALTNLGQYGFNNLCFKTPWKLMGSVAGVIGSKFIVSCDYEWTPYDNMKFSEAGTYNYGDYGYDYDPGWDYFSAGMTRTSGGSPVSSKISQKPLGFQNNNPYYDTNKHIQEYYRSTSTLRLGAEYRVTPSFSVRAGYSFVSSPVKENVKNDQVEIFTQGTLPNYRFDNTTNYVTCGVGYKYKRFYIDLAYVYKHISSTYHAFTPEVNKDPRQTVASPQSSLSLNNNQIVLSAGLKF